MEEWRTAVLGEDCGLVSLSKSKKHCFKTPRTLSTQSLGSLPPTLCLNLDTLQPYNVMTNNAVETAEGDGGVDMEDMGFKM